MQGVQLRKYGVEFTVNFDLFEVDGVDFRVDAVHASGDIKIMKDEGAEATSTNGFTEEGTGYSLVVTATEAQAARIVIYIVDQTATKAWLDKSIVIETYGNASAQHAFDLDTANVTLASATHTGAVIPTVTTLTNLPAITANWITAAGITDGAFTAAKFAASSLDGKGNWNVGKTGYTLTQSFPTNFADMAITVTTGKVTAEDVTLATSQPNYAPAKAGDNMGTVSSVTGNVDGSVGSVFGHTPQTGDSYARLGAPAGASVSADIADVPTNAEFEARTPTAAQLAYIVENAATGMPVTFTTSGGSTTAAVINQVDGASGSATDDQYNGRLLVFTNGTLKGVVTDITDYDGGTTTATITAIPFAPTASHTARLI